jgi:hypothetical protein
MAAIGLALVVSKMLAVNAVPVPDEVAVKAVPLPELRASRVRELLEDNRWVRSSPASLV